ncbi:hypothetical protein B0A49_04327 [Cryomyces minteri]|uniref:PAS domain-containing protein n=1 Tax=Cryomyces minteri TaxID=331657 RepID=A0A4U0XDT9_9PEZI|nr:hypothetical protein B0A49_04327 [Cryomyces minteri]
MSMFQNAGSIPPELAGTPSMTEMLGNGNDMMNSLDNMEILQSMDFPDLALTEPTTGAQTYAPMTPQVTSQQTLHDSHMADNPYANALDPNGGMAGAGAGPLPTGFGLTAGASGGSTLTEFTKRRNWSQRILDELKDFLHILTPDGRIQYVSPSCKYLTGYDTNQLNGKFVTEFIHPDDSGIFVREFNESIASGNPLRFFYRFRKDDGTYAIFESHGHPHLGSEAERFGPNNGAGFCKGFFMMARPYPTKNAALLLDSFLEHKIENERLTKRIAELKREEAEENEAAERHWQKKAEGHSSVTPSETNITRTDGQSDNAAFLQSNHRRSSVGDNNNFEGMPPPAKPSLGNTALTRQNLDSALSRQAPDSINDKMARYEGATHIDSIEMFTGLRYRDGERSQGISTGDTSPALIRGDAGIAILVGRDGDPRADGKNGKKKLKVADEYVCTDCGTLDSPEWRKGPGGPKTLCNAALGEEREKEQTGPQSRPCARLDAE